MMADAPLALYYAPGACSLGPHIAIEEAGLSIDYRLVDFQSSAQQRPDFLAINPHGRVPVLAIGDEMITEAPAVLLCIAARDVTGTLLPPPDTVAYGRSLQWTCWITSSLHIALAQYWRPERFIDGSIDRAAFTKAGLDKYRAHYRHIEAALEEPWIVGGRYSLCDCYMLPFYRFGVRLGMPMERDYPRLSAWKDRMLQRPAVLRALEREGLGVEWPPIASS